MSQPTTNPQTSPARGRLPRRFKLVLALLVVASWVPLVLVARARFSTSSEPRVHTFQDMGSQPKYREQQSSDLFEDGRAMRPRIDGTVARGQLQDDDHYDRGYAWGAADASGKRQPVFFNGLPPRVKLTPELLNRGQERFDIYCGVCHGLDGYGNGPVNARAVEMGESRWVAPSSLHDPQVRSREDGHLFNTITNGIRNMAPYGAQIRVEDRWAIVAWVRALQRSQNVPAGTLEAGLVKSLPTTRGNP